MIKDNFNNSISNAEKALKSWGIKYRKASNGVLYIDGNLDIRNRGLKSLPDLTKVVVQGSFDCGKNKLESLKGTPKNIGGSFTCSHNKLKNLKGAPKYINGNFWCCNNMLTSLEGAPEEIQFSFHCDNNKLKNLYGAPKKVKGFIFSCCKNKLITLKGAPDQGGAKFSCYNNELESLEGISKNFKVAYSDLGTFIGLNDVPENILYSLEVIIQMKLDIKKKNDDKAKRSITLQQPLKIKKRPSF